MMSWCWVLIRKGEEFETHVWDDYLPKLPRTCIHPGCKEGVAFSGVNGTACPLHWRELDLRFPDIARPWRIAGPVQLELPL
jgi:hypothetical protein